jgi:hypothetical protein
MQRTDSLLVIAVLWMALAPPAFSQGATQPSQPVDPTGQTPAGPVPESAAPASQPGSGPTAEAGRLRPFLGTVVYRQNRYVLRAGDLEYKLDRQAEAEPYSGKNVKVTGSLDRKTNTIRVQKIESSPAS